MPTLRRGPRDGLCHGFVQTNKTIDFMPPLHENPEVLAASLSKRSPPLASLYNLHLEPKDCSCAIHRFSATTAQLATDFTLSLCISLKNPQVTTGFSLIGFAVTWLYKER